MLNRMRAEICFCNRDDMNAAAESSAVWIVADTLAALDLTSFLDRVNIVVDPFDGFVVEAGPSSWPIESTTSL